MGSMLKYLFVVLGILAATGLMPLQFWSSDNHDSASNDIFLRFRKVFENFAGDSFSEEKRTAHNITKVGSEFNCPPSISSEVPTSVHLLRPGDIKVIGAIGDSMTTAYAAGASSYNAPIMFEYPGLSASMGGDETLEEVLTIPNILRKYNPNLIGYSTGVSSVIDPQPPNKRFNLAITGSHAVDMPEQVEKLIHAMKNDSAVDFENDWKFITMLIGANDICSSCLFAERSPENCIRHLGKAIQILHDECPRTFVNVIGIFNADQVPNLRGGPLICSVLHCFYCPCSLGGSFAKQYIHRKSKEFQELLRTSIESGKFDDKEDFTAVYQPFLEDVIFPELPEGQIDRSYFAPDCFHPSQKNHATQATAFWNNLFEPVGSKSTSYSPGDLNIRCPSSTFPYLYTNINSKPGFLSQTLDGR